MTLNDQGDGTTLMTYDGDVQVGGRLASVGQRLLDTASKSIIRQGLEALDRALQTRVASKAEGKAVEYAPPTESQFAAAVAKDMAVQIFTPARITWIVVGVLVVVAIIVALAISPGGGG